jgi:integrase
VLQRLSERTGAIVKGEKDLPIRQAMYARWFRQIARKAGIPDNVWNMDARAGGATEAEESGVALEAIQASLTHTKKETTLRYIRRRSTKIAAVADARTQKRAADQGDE